MMLEEKGREMEGSVELVMVQDERRGAREDVDSANRRQLKWGCKYRANHQLHQHLQHLQVSHHLLQVMLYFNQLEENSHGSSQDETMCPGQIEWFTSKKSNSPGEYDNMTIHLVNMTWPSTDISLRSLSSLAQLCQGQQ